MDNEIIKNISGFFTRQSNVAAAYLYGSRARCEESKKSDLDLAILFKEPITEYSKILELRVEIQNLIENTVLVGLREIHLGLSPVFLGQIISTGKVIYCRDENFRINFEVKVMRMIDDYERIRKINLYYLKKSLEEGSFGRKKDSAKIT